MRVVFMGTPTFAVATLDALYSCGHQVVLVVTQPDRPVGRGQKLNYQPIKLRALKLGLEVFQPLRVVEEKSVDRILKTKPDVIVVVGYGQILPREIFEFPGYGCLNVHASLLPSYRGAAPINWAIAKGESVTGVTTMRIGEGLDTGDVLLKRETMIKSTECAPELSSRLAVMGAELLLETIDGLITNAIVGQPQNEKNATYAPILKRKDGQIDWETSAEDIFNRMRGFDPWPGSYTSFRGKRLHVRWASPIGNVSEGPGEIGVSGKSLVIGCGNGSGLTIEKIQLEGKNPIKADEFTRGYRPISGEKVGE